LEAIMAFLLRLCLYRKVKHAGYCKVDSKCRSRYSIWPASWCQPGCPSPLASCLTLSQKLLHARQALIAALFGETQGLLSNLLLTVLARVALNAAQPRTLKDKAPIPSPNG